MNMKTVLLLSGGLDSTTLLYYLKDLGYEIYCLSFDYGQRHSKELEAAKKIAEIKKVPHKIVDITNINELLLGSSLTSDIDIPYGHYKDESMKSTVVPNRNMILLSLAIGYAVSIDADKVSYAAHSGDHAIYPDCRPIFYDRMNEVAEIANYKQIKIEAPFINIDKKEIVKIGEKLGVPFDLTWTCYEGKDEPCGKCGSCIERKEALEEAGIHL